MTLELEDLKPRAEHTRFAPVLVVGHGRSGTTIVVTLLRRYLDIAFGTESQFIVRYLRRLPSYGDLGSDANLSRLIHDIARERFFMRTEANFGFDLDQRAVLGTVRAAAPGSNQGIFVTLVDAMFGQLAHYFGFERWGDKTPEYSLHMPVLLELFPQAQFIHVLRDGRDVTLSTFHTHFGAKNMVMGAEEWQTSVTAVRAAAEHLPADQYCELKYEELLEDPATVFEGLIGFLGIADEDGRLRMFIREHIHRDLKAGNALRWRLLLSERDNERFERVAGTTLRECGYEVRTPVLMPLGRFQRKLWSLDNMLRRMAKLAYWQDNWYKLGLRVKALAGR